MKTKKANNNKTLHAAKKGKNDEFYTRIEDIERELGSYTEHFKDKVVFCNCDDPEWSNFWKYFELNFDFLGLKKLVSTHYEKDKPSYKLEIIRGKDLNGDGKHNDKDIVKTPLMQNGDFRSPEAIEILKEADIVVTNPPFSLFREYIAQLIEYGKKFVVVGHQNAVKYKEIFPLIKNNQLWLGKGFKGGAAHFINKHYEDYAKAGDHKEGMIRVSGVTWFTNLDIEKRHQKINFFEKYDVDKYPSYDNYDAINVDKVSEIPHDYTGVMGVPITFLTVYNPDEFEIIDSLPCPIINKQAIYTRIIIKRK